jgi:hypothetical protein
VRWLDLLGFAAAAAVLAGFCMNSIINLRMVALASNFLFVLYGWFAHIYPVVILHIILLPINLLKLHRIKSEAHSAEPSPRGNPRRAKNDDTRTSGSGARESSLHARRRTRSHPANQLAAVPSMMACSVGVQAANLRAFRKTVE